LGFKGRLRLPPHQLPHNFPSQLPFQLPTPTSHQLPNFRPRSQPDPAAARSRTQPATAKRPRPPEGFFVTHWRRVANWLPLDTETAAALAFFFAANAAFSLFWLDAIPRLSRLALYASIGCLTLFLILAASNLFRICLQETVHEAVVLVEKADVLSGPASDSPTLFSIHEGLKVRIENDLSEWVQISLENGWNGWVKNDTLGEI
jgi:hypothetical protein